MTMPAVITAAGSATRFRPYSATQPKEMLPIGPRPAVEHVIGECLAAGATHVTVVTRPGDFAIPAHVAYLRATEGLPVDTVTEDLSFGYGNATPLLTLRDRLGDAEAFMVAFGDDILLGESSPGANLAAMAQRVRDGAEGAIAAQLIDPAATGTVGIIDTRAGHPEFAARIRQRPDPATVAEPLAVVSRLVLRPAILEHLVATDAARGEVDLGIAVSRRAEHGADVAVHRITGTWVTVGDPRSYRDALNTYWTHHPEPAHP